MHSTVITSMNMFFSGGGPAPILDPITEKVISIVGETNVSVIGINGGLDTCEK